MALFSKCYDPGEVRLETWGKIIIYCIDILWQSAFKQEWQQDF